MARGFGARESSVGLAGSAAADIARSVSKSRSELESAQKDLDAANAKGEALWNEATALDDVRRGIENKIEKENKQRIIDEVKAELGDEFDKFHGEPGFLDREEDRTRWYDNPTKGEEEVDKRMRELKESNEPLKKAWAAVSEARNRFYEHNKVKYEASDKVRKLTQKEAKEMESLMNKVEGDGKEEGEIGDGRIGNGVKTADGKTRLRLEDFAYLMNSVQMEDFENGDQEDETSNQTHVLPYFKAGFSENVTLPFSFYISLDDNTRTQRFVSSVSLDVDEAAKELTKYGFTFDEKDLKAFANGFDRVAQKRAPVLKGRDEY